MMHCDDEGAKSEDSSTWMTLTAEQIDLYSQEITPAGEHPLLPSHGWRARYDWWPEFKCKPFSLPRFSQLPEILKMTWNYVTRFYFQKLWGEKRLPFIDGMHQVQWEPIYGVPMGGIGGGSIGRGFRGEFCRFQLIPGMVYHERAAFSQWLVTVRRRGGTVLQQVLSVHAEPTCNKKPFSNTWSWSYPTNQGAFVGLYPRSYYLYRLNSVQIVLLCEQMSPVLPHDYEDSCLPVTTFQWTVYNLSNEECDVSITLVWQAGFGTHEHPLLDDQTWSEVIELSNLSNDNTQYSSQTSPSPTTGDEERTAQTNSFRGCLLHQQCKRLACTFGFGAYHSSQTNVSVVPRFHSINAAQKVNGYKSISKCLSSDDIWRGLANTGNLESITKTGANGSMDNGQVTSGLPSPDDYLSAVCVQCHLPPRTGISQYKFVFAWHSPTVRFRSEEINYRRRYMRWFPEDPRQGTISLIRHCMLRWKQWSSRLDAWQKPILLDITLPDWYKSALFNELYFIADGGTVWLDPINYSLNEELDKIPIKQEIGYFAYLEGHEYRMFNTYDVHYYASWSLIKLWPKLQLALQYDFGYLTKSHDPSQVYVIHTNRKVERSRPRCVPHDVGDPEDEPWQRINAYVMYDTNEWKDLNCKFLLQVFRDWILMGDRDYLEWMVPICVDVVRRSLEWDTDNDGIIDNGGYADQTYDAWTVTGASAYTGGLWLAGLFATCRMMREVGMDCSEFQDLLTKAKDNFVKKLWNGRYFLYDRSGTRHHTAIMSDQLNGHWYLKSCGVFDNALFREDHIHRAIETIFEHNVCQVGLGNVTSTDSSKGSVLLDEDRLKGEIGAVNGMMPEHGRRDISSVHAEEFWIGVNYSLASLCIMEGYIKEGFKIAGGCYETVWRRFGLQYQGPEAYFDDGRFRSLGYMRPLCVWSIQHALEMRKEHDNKLANTMNATAVEDA